MFQPLYPKYLKKFLFSSHPKQALHIFKDNLQFLKCFRCFQYFNANLKKCPEFQGFFQLRQLSTIEYNFFPDPKTRDPKLLVHPSNEESAEISTIKLILVRYVNAHPSSSPCHVPGANI